MLARRRRAGRGAFCDRLLRRVRTTRSARSRSAKSKPTCGSDWMAGSSSTARSTRSGASAASSRTSRPPNEWPTHCAPRTPAASSVSSTSCACVAIVQGGSQLGDAVAAQVGREHAEAAGEPLFGELAEAAPVRVDAVEADDRRGGRSPHSCRLSSICVSLVSVLALLYDIHGNLVGARAGAGGCRGRRGRRATCSAATTARGRRGRSRRSSGCAGCRARPGSAATASAGLREPPLDRPEVAEAIAAAKDSGVGTDEGWLYSLQAQGELDGVLYVHGSPLSDVESFPPEPGDDDERMLDGVRDTDRRLRPQPSAVPAAGAERHDARQSGQRRDAARRRRACGVRAAGRRRRVRVSPRRVRRRARCAAEALGDGSPGSVRADLPRSGSAAARD